MPGRRSLVVAALLSGASGLLYQEMWARALRLSFGGSGRATGTVLAAFVGGIGIGSVLLGRRIERSARPARVYAWMEIGIALYGLVSLPILTLVDRAYSVLHDPLHAGSGATGLRAALSLAALAVPTLLMGGTLPALSAALTGQDDASRRAVGWAYGSNTLGAMAGAALGAFVLLGAVGMRGTVLCAVAGNAVAAAIAWTIPAGSAASAAARPAPVAWFPCLAGAVSGASTMALEVVWTRTLSGLLGGTHRVFGLMLAVVLFGIGAGGLAYSRIFRDRPPTRATWAVLAAAQALGALALLPLAGPLADALYLALPLPMGSTGLYALSAGAVAAVALPTSFCAGLGYPMLAALSRPGREGVSSDVGALGLGSAAGSIAGALGGSFVLIPLVGTHATVRIAATLVAIVAIWAAVSGRARRIVLGAAALPILLALLPGRFPARFLESSATTLTRVERLPTPRTRAEFRLRSRRVREHQEEGADATAIVLRTDSQRTMYINGKPDASSWRDMGTQTLVGALPALLHPGARTALVIGLGSGTSAGWLAASPRMRRVDVAEIEPAMVRAARLFERFHPPALESRKVRVLIEDGRTLVGAGRARWDVIASEPSNPWLGGAASLYTREFYERSRERLGRRGVFAQWLQTYGIDGPTLALVIRTFGLSFRHVAMVYSGSRDVVLLGSGSPLALEPGTLGRRLEALGAFPVLRARLGLAEPSDLAGCVLAAGPGLLALGARAEGLVHTDDNARIELGAGAQILHAGADHVASIVRDRRRRPSLLAALGVGAEDAGDLFAAQARCLGSDSPDAARAARALAREAGAAPTVGPPRPSPPSNIAEARRALATLGSAGFVDPQEASRIAEGLSAIAEQAGPEAREAALLLERGFPAGVLYLTRAQVLLSLGLARGDGALCLRASRTLVGAHVLEPAVLAQVGSCLAGHRRSRLQDSYEELLEVSDSVEPPAL